MPDNRPVPTLPLLQRLVRMPAIGCPLRIIGQAGSPALFGRGFFRSRHTPCAVRWIYQVAPSLAVGMFSAFWSVVARNHAQTRTPPCAPQRSFCRLRRSSCYLRPSPLSLKGYRKTRKTIPSPTTHPPNIAGLFAAIVRKYPPAAIVETGNGGGEP